MISAIVGNAKWFFYHSNLLEKDREDADLKREIAKANISGNRPTGR